MQPLEPSHLRSRLAMHRGAKTGLLLGLAVGICGPYVALQHSPLFPLRQAPVTALDAWIAFDPGWIYAYLSIALLVPLFPLLATQREALSRYAIGLALLCGACFLAFLLFPTAGPRPEAAPEHGLYGLLVRYDEPLNSLPSLHAGLTLYSFLFGYRILREDLDTRGRGLYLLVAGTWGAGILYATVATKQHWVVDVPSGMLIAWLAHRWAWRGSAEA